jgi:hypothetical protein
MAKKGANFTASVGFAQNASKPDSLARARSACDASAECRARQRLQFYRDLESRHIWHAGIEQSGCGCYRTELGEQSFAKVGEVLRGRGLKVGTGTIEKWPHKFGQPAKWSVQGLSQR